MHNSPFKLISTQQNNLILTYILYIRDDAANRADGHVVTVGRVCCVTQQSSLQWATWDKIKMIKMYILHDFTKNLANLYI